MTNYSYIELFNGLFGVSDGFENAVVLFVVFLAAYFGILNQIRRSSSHQAGDLAKKLLNPLVIGALFIPIVNLVPLFLFFVAVLSFAMEKMFSSRIEG